MLGTARDRGGEPSDGRKSLFIKSAQCLVWNAGRTNGGRESIEAAVLRQGKEEAISLANRVECKSDGCVLVDRAETEWRYGVCIPWRRQAEENRGER